jgi:hypothetical protein
MTILRLLRILGSTLPQVLALLLVGGWLDLLGGWNHTDAAFGTLILLFLFSPLMALSLLVTELLAYRKLKKGGQTSPSFSMPGLAMFLVSESFAINLFILTQVRMH